MKKRLPRWLGSLLRPAEDPRRDAADSPAAPDAAALLDELRRSRAELAQLRSRVAPQSRLALELAEEEQALLEAEQNLLLSVSERQARAALVQARRRAIEAEVWAEDG